MNSSDRPFVWFRYVDDTYTIFRNKDTAINFLHYTHCVKAEIFLSILDSNMSL